MPTAVPPSGKTARRCPAQRPIPSVFRAEASFSEAAGSASSTAAALLDPPPSPPPRGIRLVSLNRRRPVARVAFMTASAARRMRLPGIFKFDFSSICVRPRSNSTSIVSASEMVWKMLRSSWNPSGSPVKHPQIQIDLGQRTKRANARASVLNQRVDFVALKLFAPVQKIQFQDEPEARHLAV